MEHPKNICGVAKFFKQKSAVARLRVQQKKVESQQRRLQEEEEIQRQRRRHEEKVLQETTSYWRKISLPAKLETVIYNKPRRTLAQYTAYIYVIVSRKTATTMPPRNPN